MPECIVNHSLSPSIFRGVGLSSGEFEFSSSYGRTCDTEIQYFSDDALVLILPCTHVSSSVGMAKFGTQYTFTCVGESGAYVVTSNAVRPATTEVLTRLHAIVGAIAESRAIPIAPSLNDLLTQAAASRGTPRNLTAWAHQLAEDVGHLTD